VKIIDLLPALGNQIRGLSAFTKVVLLMLVIERIFINLEKEKIDLAK
jgi:hypothetical protein